MRASTRFWLLSLLAWLAAAGCASVPTEPSLLVLPGRNASFEQFQADDAACRDYARSRSADSQRRYDNAYIQCMYAKGHRVPVEMQGEEPEPTAQPGSRVPPPPPGRPPAPPPGT